MTDISKIKVGESEYQLKDVTAREQIAKISGNSITYGYTDLEDGVSALNPGQVYLYIAPEGPYRWYLVDGITEENVIAAYHFKGAETQAEALTNVNENGSYPLTITGSVMWTTGQGLFFPAEIDCYVNNTNLTNKTSSIISCAFGYSGGQTGSLYTAGVALSTTATNPKYLMQNMETYLSSSKTYPRGHIMPISSTSNKSKIYDATTTDGCLACDWSTYSMWRDGTKLSLTSGARTVTQKNYYVYTPPRVFTTNSASYSNGTIYIESLVFYNCVLTNAQHLQLATQINAL
jgi:hypothetical protein